MANCKLSTAVFDTLKLSASRGHDKETKAVADDWLTANWYDGDMIIVGITKGMAIAATLSKGKTVTPYPLLIVSAKLAYKAVLKAFDHIKNEHATKSQDAGPNLKKLYNVTLKSDSEVLILALAGGDAGQLLDADEETIEDAIEKMPAPMEASWFTCHLMTLILERFYDVFPNYEWDETLRDFLVFAQKPGAPLAIRLYAAQNKLLNDEN